MSVRTEPLARRRGPLAAAAALLAFLASAACGGPELQPKASPGPLHGCALEEEPGVRTWRCGELLAQELAAGAATDVEVRAVLDEFATSLAESKAARTDVPWADGPNRYPSVRLEGTTPSGQKFVAQMIVLSRVEGSRVIQCVSRNPVAPCEPVLDHLIRN